MLTRLECARFLTDFEQTDESSYRSGFMAYPGIAHQTA